MATVVADNLKKIPLPKNTVAIARQDGRIYIVDFSEMPQLDDAGAIDWNVSVSKLMVSKIQDRRTRLLTMEEFEVENVVHTDQFPEGTFKDLELTVFATLDGKNQTLQTTPKLAIDEGGFVRGALRMTGMNFAIQVRGTYNINTMTVTYHNNGRR